MRRFMNVAAACAYWCWAVDLRLSEIVNPEPWVHLPDAMTVTCAIVL